MPKVRTAAFSIAALVAYLSSFPGGVYAATPLAALRFSSDITIALGSIIVTPADVAADNLSDTVTFVDIGSIPADAHVDAYHRLPNGDQLLSFDTTITLAGITATPADVVRFNGVIYTLEFDASASGVPEGVNTDAIALDGGKLVLSFDTSVNLGGTTFQDDDLVEVVGGGGGFVPYFSGAAAGVPDELDVDGAQVLGPMHLLLSFDGSGRIGGVDFDDEDILEYTGPGAGTWELVYDGSSLHAGMDAADLVGLFAIVAQPTAVPTASVAATATPTPSVVVTAPPTSTAPVPPTGTPPPTPTTTGPPLSTATSVPTTAVAATPTPTPSVEGTASPTSTAPVPPTETPLPTPTITGGPPLSTATTVPTTSAEATSTPSPIGTPGVGPTSTPVPCTGDCNGSGEVTVNELLVMVNIALGNAQVSDCLAGDGNGSGEITIDEILLAVNHALTGC